MTESTALEAGQALEQAEQEALPLTDDEIADGLLDKYREQQVVDQAADQGSDGDAADVDDPTELADDDSDCDLSQAKIKAAEDAFRLACELTQEIENEIAAKKKD